MSTMSLVDSIKTEDKKRKATVTIKKAFASIPNKANAEGKKLFRSVAASVVSRKRERPQDYTYSHSNHCHHFFLDHDQPELFVTTVWKNSGFYLKWRYFAVAFVLFVMLFSYFRDWKNYKKPHKWFIFLQNWGMLVQSICVMLQAYTATRHACRDPLLRKDNAYSFKLTKPMKLMWVTYNISLPMSYFTLLTYLIFHFDIEYLSYSFRFFGMAIYVFADQMVCNIPLRYQHFYMLSSFMSIYLAFTVIYANVKGTNYFDKKYIYEYLDWSNTEKEARALLNAILLMFVVTPLIWAFCFAIYKLRDRYLVPLLQKMDIDDDLHIFTFGTVVATVGTIIVPHVAAELKKKSRGRAHHSPNVKLMNSELNIAFKQYSGSQPSI